MWSGTTGSAVPPGTATHVQKQAWSGPAPVTVHRNVGGPTDFLPATPRRGSRELGSRPSCCLKRALMCPTRGASTLVGWARTAQTPRQGRASKDTPRLPRPRRRSSRLPARATIPRSASAPKSSRFSSTRPALSDGLAGPSVRRSLPRPSLAGSGCKCPLLAAVREERAVPDRFVDVAPERRAQRCRKEPGSCPGGRLTVASRASLLSRRAGGYAVGGGWGAVKAWRMASRLAYGARGRRASSACWQAATPYMSAIAMISHQRAG
jgi:hypothetical protein